MVYQDKITVRGITTKDANGFFDPQTNTIYLDELQEIWDNALAKTVMNYQASEGTDDNNIAESLNFERKKTRSRAYI